MMDRHGVEFSGERLGERLGDRLGEVGRQDRMPSRWPSGSPTNQHHRFLRGGVGGVSGNEGFAGARYHPYRAQPEYPPTGSGFGGGPGFRGVQWPRDGPGNLGGHKMPIGGHKHGFEGVRESPDYGEGNKFAKLFIGSVPRTATEEDIRPLFAEHGDVIEVALIKDKRTGQQQGCCFIKYATLEHAERAIRALHNQYTLPGGTGPIQVRYADGERERLGTVEEKLFVAILNKRATEKEVEEIFAPYGHVEDVYLMKDEMKQSRGCGFVKFSSRDMALTAMNALHGSYIMPGCDQPLIVRFADRKKPRPIEQRGTSTFGGPGFGPRFDAIIPNRQLSNFDAPGGGHMPHNGWDEFSPPMQPPHGLGSHTDAKDGIATTSATGSGTYGEDVAPTNGTSTNPAPISSTSQQNFTPSNVEVLPAAGQLLPLQKSFMGSQNVPPSGTPHNTLLSSSTTQTQALQAPTPIQQIGQLQLPQSIGLNSLNQVLLAQQFPSFGGQLSASSSLILQNATAAAMQNPLGLQQQGLVSVPSPQQFPTSNIPQQLIQQSTQQLPSQMLLQQQAQTLQSSYQSSQQAIFQIQQQLQMMQQSNLSQQQNSMLAKQQTQWTTGQTQWTGPPPTSSAPANIVATTLPSTISANPSHPSNAPAGAVTLTCNWTEHTSPEGFKYYYNSATRESRWEKPEDLTLFEQQQKQQKLFILQQQQQQQQQVLQQQQQQQVLQQQQQQQNAPQHGQSSSHTTSQALVQTMQRASQSQVQPQLQLRHQAQLQILQPSLAHSASSAAGHPTVQDLSYAQLNGASSITDSARSQQVAQGWAWKNKTGGS